MSTLTLTAPRTHKAKRKETRYIQAGIPLHEKIGTKIVAQTVEEVLDQANLNWSVSKRPLLTTIDPQPILKGGNPAQYTSTIGTDLMPLTDQFAVVRDDINYVFATVGQVYTPISNEECMQVVEPLMKDFGLTVNHAGVFEYGAHVWATCELPERLVIKGKEFKQVIKISFSHNGTEKLMAQFLYVSPLGTTDSPSIPGSVNAISIRHTKTAHLRTAEAADIMLKQREHAFNYKKIVEGLMDTECENFKEYMKSVFPKSTDENSKDFQTVEALSDAYEEFSEGFHSKWNAYQTVVEFAENGTVVKVHKQGAMSADAKDVKREESRLKNSFSGAAQTLKQKAWAALTGSIK